MFQKFVDGASVPADESLADGRNRVLVDSIDIHMILEKQVKTLHLISLDGKVQQCLPIIIINIRVTLLYFKQILHTFVEAPLVRVREIFNIGQR